MAHFTNRPFSDDGFVISNLKGLTFDIVYGLAHQVVSHLLDDEHQCQAFFFDRVVPMFSSDHNSTQVVDCLLMPSIIILG